MIQATINNDSGDDFRLAQRKQPASVRCLALDPEPQERGDSDTRQREH